MTLVAGVDCSTQTTKVLVVDLDTGAVVAEGRREHVVTGVDGARETDPEVWWDALTGALADTGRAGDVAAIAVGGQQHGLCVLGDDGAPLRPAMLWNDTRAADDARSLVDQWGADVWAERVGVVPVASFTAAKWAWLRRNEPDVAARTAAVRLPHDLLTERLSGAAVTDRGDASGTAWWSTRTGDYVEEVLALPAVDLDPALLPRVAPPDEVVDTVSARAVEELGLSSSCVVGPGTGDNAAAALGLGLGAGEPAVSLGTSGTAYAVSSTRIVDPSGTVAGFADATDGYLPLAATLNCTQAVDRFAALLGLDREDVADDVGDVVVLPYLDGERTPNLPRAAGTVVGVRHATSGGQVLRAAYEGAAASLLDAIDAIDECSSGIDEDAPIVLIGGGARGAAWQAVVAELSGRALHVPANQELVAMGAAVQAAVVLTGRGHRELAEEWETRAGTVVPAPDRADPRGRRAAIARTRELAGDLLDAPDGA